MHLLHDHLFHHVLGITPANPDTVGNLLNNKLNSISFSINCTCQETLQKTLFQSGRVQCEYSIWVADRLKHIVD